VCSMAGLAANFLQFFAVLDDWKGKLTAGFLVLLAGLNTVLFVLFVYCVLVYNGVV